MMPDVALLREHASLALSRGLLEYLASFQTSAPGQVLDHQIGALVSLNRGIELLAKCWLYTVDPVLVCVPLKHDSYLRLRGLAPLEDFWETTHTITGIEALVLIERLRPGIRIGSLKGLNSVRNSLEHFPVYDAQHLKQKLDSVAQSVIVELEGLVCQCFKEPMRVFVSDELAGAAKACQRTDDAQRYLARVAEHREEWTRWKDGIRDRLVPFPTRYGERLLRQRLSATCPVCHDRVWALYDYWVDLGDGSAEDCAVYGDVRCITCPTCHLWTDEFYGISQFVPDCVLDEHDLLYSEGSRF